MNPWSNRKAEPFEWVEYEGRRLYYRQEGRLVTEICCGERYAHIDAGLVFRDEQYRGSYIDDWHGGPHGSLTEIVEWLAEAVFDGPNGWFLPEEITR